MGTPFLHGVVRKSLSCSFRVLASESGLEITAARLRPWKAAETVGLERYVGRDFKKTLTIMEIVGRAEPPMPPKGPAVRHPPRTAVRCACPAAGHPGMCQAAAGWERQVTIRVREVAASRPAGESRGSGDRQLVRL
ncbi:hypothetical protein [Streptomyces sp. NPDC057429]|uniref:hypothetical protein n=1 Tax=Streptomyces sp. NPDC057429 TaxID=3346130 RepID=UPI0036CD9A35